MTVSIEALAIDGAKELDKILAQIRGLRSLVIEEAEEKQKRKQNREMGR